jgi:coenzyme F420-reducing hydrogenase gamma subunit
MAKPRIGIYKFSGCSGCQLQFLNMENELLDLAGAVEIVHFIEAKRHNSPEPVDVGFVEGSISTSEEVERIKQVRERCTALVAMGACATSGGIQALRNWGSLQRYKAAVYEHTDKVDCMEWSTDVAAFVPVDYKVEGCPPNREELAEVVVAALAGRKPYLRPHAVCVECKLKNNVCILISEGAPCLGPVTKAGCGAICPSYGRPCYGCFGPANDFNAEGMGCVLERLGLSPREIVRKYRQFNAYREQFRRAAELYE